jgi:Uma2 family endonuclease
MSLSFVHISASEKPPARRFRYAEYRQLVESGFFDGDRVELIDGELLTMSPATEPHNVVVLLARESLERAFGAGNVVRPQMSLGLAELESCPEPDLAVVRGSPRDFRSLPDTAVLVVEVSVSSLAYDLGPKASLYAFAGVPEYWVIDVTARRLVVHREPEAGRFRSVVSLAEDQSATPLSASGTVRVADLLP